MNRVILVGNVGQDPVVRTTKTGRRMATFSVATRGFGPAEVDDGGDLDSSIPALVSSQHDTGSNNGGSGDNDGNGDRTGNENGNRHGNGLPNGTVGERKTREITDWHRIEAWESQSKLIEQYVHKGSLLGIEGRHRTRSSTNAEGKKSFISEVVLDRLHFLGRNSAKEPYSGDQTVAET